MRLLRITTNNLAYLDRFYAARPGLAAQPYAAQHADLMADCYGWADFWGAALGRLGYETGEIVANVEPMQKRWALEHGLSYQEIAWPLEITAAQVKAFRPDVLFVTDYTTFGAGYLRRLKSECPSVKLVLGWCGAPYSDPSVFREYDLVLSCIPELVHHFREQNHRCYHVNHAFEPRVLEKVNTAAQLAVDFAFIGSIVKRERFHTEREKLLLDLIERNELQIWSDACCSSPSPVRRRAKARQIAYDAVHMAQRIGIPQSFLTATPVVRKVARWEARPTAPHDVDVRIARRARPPLFGVAMFQQLRNTKVALNTHIDISPASASNMRLYEATGVGTCLLTDWKVNLRDLFELDSEVVTYRSSEECVEKARYLLDHEAERQSIADAGQRRTLRNHTFAERAAGLDEIIQEHILR